MATKQKPKFNWEEFLQKGKKVIHCSTRQEVEQCLELLESHGIVFHHRADWYWNECGRQGVCLSNSWTFDKIDYYNRTGVPIYKFSSYDFSE